MKNRMIKNLYVPTSVHLEISPYITLLHGFKSPSCSMVSVGFDQSIKRSKEKFGLACYHTSQAEIDIWNKILPLPLADSLNKC